MSERVLSIAHRAGNERSLLHAALAAGADVAEADVWPYRGRLEVRHLKTMGPVPLLWDRWKLASAWAPRLLIAQLLEQVPAGIGLMLDLKGHDRSGAQAVADAAGYLAYEHRLYVCARDWAMLEPFRETGAVVVHSAGRAGEVERLLPLIESGACSAVSVHQKLLTPALVARLRERLHTVMSWPVNDTERMRELVSWGVNGITTDSLEVVRAMRRDSQTAG
ncbi:MAG: hypothetical protein C0506_04200 [Anaerolinea sp.]|nr:hypothetical protein [Anaerolinea sp.]